MFMDVNGCFLWLDNYRFFFFFRIALWDFIHTHTFLDMGCSAEVMQNQFTALAERINAGAWTLV